MEPPRRKNQTQWRSYSYGHMELWVVRPCHLCGALTWYAQGAAGKPECPDCPRPAPDAKEGG